MRAGLFWSLVAVHCPAGLALARRLESGKVVVLFRLEFLRLGQEFAGQAAQAPRDGEVDGRAREREQPFRLPPEIHRIDHFAALACGVKSSSCMTNHLVPAAFRMPAITFLQGE